MLGLDHPGMIQCHEKALPPRYGTLTTFASQPTRPVSPYAATRRAREGDGAGFVPTLTVTTRDTGEAVEIRVRDNGTGIPAEIRDKLFQPFFTTKPTGEGTGLGLSITYDIVTKQHGGTITVEKRGR